MTRRILISDASKQLIEAHTSAGHPQPGGAWTGGAWSLEVDEQTYQRLIALHPTDMDEAIRRAACKQFGHA